MDGLGLVYQGQGNTGSAAYNQPSLQYGQTPLDDVAQNIEKQNLIKQQQEFLLAKQKEKQKAEVLAKLGDINLSKFALGNKQEFAKNIINHKNQIAKDMSEGRDVSDPTSHAYIATQERLLALQNQKLELDKQGEIIDNAMKILQDKPDEFDVEKSTAAIKAYTEAPNMTERMKIDPSTLLVRKPKVFTTFDPTKTLDVNSYIGGYAIDTPESGRSGKYLREKDLRGKITDIANDPSNQEHFEWGKTNGLWDTKAEYENVLYTDAKRKFNPYYKSVVKNTKVNEPNDRDYLMTANTDELKKKFGLGETTAEVFSGSGANAPQKIKIANTIDIGNIKVTIPNASAIDAKSGNQLEGTDAIEVTSGKMGTPLVFNSTGKLVAIPSNGVYKLKDSRTGVVKEYKGTQKQIEAQLIRDGLAKYKPMLLATYKQDDQTNTAWIPASALPTTNESKTLQGADAARLMLERIAEEENAKAAQTNVIAPPKVVTKIKAEDLRNKYGY